MRRAITFVSRSIAILFSILFILAMVLVLLLETAQYALLNPQIYNPLLEEHQVYDRLPALMAEQSALLMRFLGGSELPQMKSEAGSPDDNLLTTASAWIQSCARQAIGDDAYEALYNDLRMPTLREARKINACKREERRNERLSHPGIGDDLTPILQDFSTEQWEGFIRLLLPAEDLRRMTEATLDKTSAYLNGQTDTVSVPLLDLKKHLTGQEGDKLILFILSAQPPCTDEEQAQILAGNFENRGDTAIYCAASGAALEIMLPAMRNRLEKVASQIPTDAVLIGPSSAIDIPGSGIPSGGDRQLAIRNIRDWMRFSPLLPLSLLLLMTLFGVRSAKGWLRWWGIPFLIAGLITLGIGLAAQPLLDLALPGFSSGLGELGLEVSRSLAGELGKWLMIEGGLLILPGLAGILRPNQIHQPRSKLSENQRAFTAPEISEAEAREQIPSPPRRRDDTGYT